MGDTWTRGNEVYLVDVNAARVEAIEREGVWIHEQDGTEGQYRPHAVTDAAGLPEMDLVIVFVKAMHTESALSANRALIGPGTYLMTLQNGAGHEARLLAVRGPGSCDHRDDAAQRIAAGERAREPRRRRTDDDRSAGGAQASGSRTSQKR